MAYHPLLALRLLVESHWSRGRLPLGDSPTYSELRSSCVTLSSRSHPGSPVPPATDASRRRHALSSDMSYPVGRRRLLLEGSCGMSPQADTGAPASGMEPREGLGTQELRRLVRRWDPPSVDAGALSIDVPRGVADIWRQVATPQGDVRPRAHVDDVETRSLVAYPMATP
jgi:hypothetical protein